MFLATPYRGRAIPFSFITYSSKTINAGLSSRNMEHIKSTTEPKELLEDRILVMHREFSYELMFDLSFGCVDTHVGAEGLLVRDWASVLKKAFTYTTNYVNRKMHKLCAYEFVTVA
jgi:hypothetical protein